MVTSIDALMNDPRYARLIAQVPEHDRATFIRIVESFSSALERALITPANALIAAHGHCDVARVVAINDPSGSM